MLLFIILSMAYQICMMYLQMFFIASLSHRLFFFENDYGIVYVSWPLKLSLFLNAEKTWVKKRRIYWEPFIGSLILFLLIIQCCYLLESASNLPPISKCVQESGRDSQERKKDHIKRLLVAATYCEPQYLIRLLQVPIMAYWLKYFGGLSSQYL